MTNAIDLPAICRALGWLPMGDSGLYYDHWNQVTREPAVDVEDAIDALDATENPGGWTIMRLPDATYNVRIYHAHTHVPFVGAGGDICEAACRALTAWAWARAMEMGDE